ncbi:MAG: hypothetical protein QF798_02870 [Candidatus Woesearchaeota archaeon]|jgi:hypothetical protein|nr:hypothetical protein [Candidatus Woesearchaeota archaeon]|tara:strand:+ start:492 stop:737 length:246 start_codon:yes stop_codon:yes gene_type:complete
MRTPYGRLSPESKEVARTIYETKQDNPSISYESIVKQHPEFTFKTGERARQLYQAHKAHLSSVKGRETIKERKKSLEQRLS